MSVAIESVTVEMDAPQAFVWDVLVDYGRYPEWNPYTVRVETRLEVGADVVLHLPHPDQPGETMQNVEVMRVIDAPHHLQYDTADNLPGIFAVRDQWVKDGFDAVAHALKARAESLYIASVTEVTEEQARPE